MFARVTKLASAPASGLLAAAVAATALFAATTLASPADAAPRDKQFFDGVQGEWSGPGEIVAGKYKGTKFTCKLSGASLDGSGMSLDGTCRVGIFRQPMKAVIQSAGRTYKGEFLDGADGKGLDIVSGNVTGQKIVVGITRAKLNGAMIARLQGKNTMTVTISVKVENQMVPVIGMNLNRQTDEIAVGSVD